MSVDGQRIYATLLRLEDEKVVLDWRGKETKVALAKLGDEDLKYVDEFRSRIPFGKVGTNAWNQLLADQDFKQWLFRQKVE